MKLIAHAFSVSCLFVAAIIVLPDEQAVDNSQRTDDQRLIQRVDQLEQRVEQLESILFSTAKLTVAQAERRLADAKQAVDHAERLFAKGFITEFQLQQDRFNIRQAEAELKLANAERSHQGIAVKIDVLNAEQRLEEARQRLEHTRSLVQKGFASPGQLQRTESDVNLAERALKNAQLKLKATEQIETIKNQEK